MLASSVWRRRGGGCWIALKNNGRVSSIQNSSLLWNAENHCKLERLPGTVSVAFVKQEKKDTQTSGSWSKFVSDGFRHLTPPETERGG